MASCITQENPELLEMATISEVVGEKFVGSTSERDEGFDAVLAATVLDETYDEFLGRTSEAFDKATPSQLSQLALEALSETSQELGLSDVNNVGISGNGIEQGGGLAPR